MSLLGTRLTAAVFAFGLLASPPASLSAPAETPQGTRQGTPQGTAAENGVIAVTTDVSYQLIGRWDAEKLN